MDQYDVGYTKGSTNEAKFKIINLINYETFNFSLRKLVE